jgi:hypothetical protein
MLNEFRVTEMYWERNNRLLMAASPEFPRHFLHLDREAIERWAAHDTRFGQVSRSSVSALVWGVLWQGGSA